MAARWALAAGLVHLLPLLPLASSSNNLVFPLRGSVYPAGFFYVTLNIGEPARPYFMDIDTGSSVSWLECNPGSGFCRSCNQVPHPLYQAIRRKFVPCASPLCDALQQDIGTRKDCRKLPEQCSYKVNYLDQGTSTGVLVLDKLSIANTAPIDLAFGCGYRQKKSERQPVAVDGLLGLGRGSMGLISQLKHGKVITRDVMGHCLSTKGGGFLFIGGEANPPASRVTWVPMAPATPGKANHYSPGRAKLHLDTKPVGANSLQVVFDSGSTYTYLPKNLYTELTTELQDSLSKSLKKVNDPIPILPLCWKGPRPFRSVEDLKREFKPLLSLKFDSGVTMTMPPENYLVITERGTACLGVLAIDIDIYIIGDVALQDQLVIYDNEKGQIGWMHYPCDNPTSEIFSRM